MYPNLDSVLSETLNLDCDVLKNIPLADSHCHLLQVYEHDTKVLQHVSHYRLHCILDVAIDPNDWERRQDLFAGNSNVCFSVGIHPSLYDAKKFDESYNTITHHASQACAIGESGLDWYHNYVDANTQYRFFEMQLDIAQEYNKPIIIHARNSQDLQHNAIDDVIRIMKQKNYTAGGVMHCFSGTYEQAKQCLDLGMYISFAASISYNSAKDLQEVVPKIPADYLLAETDAPYLSHRHSQKYQSKYRKKNGKHNHSLYLPFLYNTLALLRKDTVCNIAQTVYANLCRFTNHQQYRPLL